MMDKMDRMLRALPEQDPSPELAARIRLAVHRRHHRRQLARRAGASLLGLLGLWLAWPGIAWLSSGDLYASGTPWLLGSVDYFNAESLDLMNRFLNDTFSAQNAFGSGFALSIWLGALLLCLAIFLVIDSRAWQPVSRRPSHGGSPTMLSPSVHM